MKVELYVCEGCGNRVEDIYAAIGWMQIDGAITRHQGRGPDRCGITDFIAAPVRHIVDSHTFCSVGCLAKKLNDIQDERERAKLVKDASCGRGRCDCFA